MTRIALLLLITALSGCSALVQQLPTVKHCHEVRYSRSGTDVEFAAQCTLPSGATSPIEQALPLLGII